jgi:hypothetical protein
VQTFVADEFLVKALSLKHLFTAEWGVFAALGFSLHATPMQVAFHFKRLMKTLEWNILDYLGTAMYTQWQDTLVDEEERRLKRERRKETRRKEKEERILNLHFEIETEVLKRKTERARSNGSDESPTKKPEPENVRKSELDVSETQSTIKKDRRIKLFNRFALRRAVSQERIDLPDIETAEPKVRRRKSDNGRLALSPSMPSLHTDTLNLTENTGFVAIDIDQKDAASDKSSNGSKNASYRDGIIV